MFERKTPYGKYAFFFIAGAISGGFVALLYAPKTGRKFQRQVKDVLDEQMDNVQNVLRKVANT